MEMLGFDAYSPQQIAQRIEAVGVAKARLPPVAMFVLGVCAGGFIGLGAIGLAVIVRLSHHGDLNQGGVAAQYVKIAGEKVALPFWEAFFKGVLCNVLVCLAVWMAMAGRSVTDKVVSILFPVSAFVAAGFEHSVANMYLIPLGFLFSHGAPSGGAVPDWLSFAASLVPVTLGNMAGGSILVAAIYHLIYRRALERNA